MIRTARILPAAVLITAALVAEGCQRHTPASPAPAATSTTTTSTQTSAPPAPAADTAAPPSEASTAPSAAPAPATPGAEPTYGAGNASQPYAAGAPARFGGRRGRLALTLPQFQAWLRRRIMSADTNNDGRVSLQEWVAFRAAHPRPNGGGVDPTRQFQHLDLNHDGFITPDEIDVISARRYAHRMQMSGGTARPAAGADANDQGVE